MKRAAKIIARKGKSDATKPAPRAIADVIAKPQQKLVDLPSDHPSVRRVLEAADEFLDAKEREHSGSKRSRESRSLSLPRKSANDLSGEASEMAFMFAAVHRLSMWGTDCGDRLDEMAAEQALKAIAILGSMKADYICKALGGHGGPAGMYLGEVEKYGGALGLKRRESHV